MADMHNTSTPPAKASKEKRSYTPDSLSDADVLFILLIGSWTLFVLFTL